MASVFGKTWSAISSNPPLFIGLTLVAVLVSSVPSLFLFRHQLTAFWVTTFVTGLCSSVVSGMISYAVYQSLTGARPSLRDSVSRGMSCFLPLVGVSFLSYVAITLGFAALLVPGIMLMCVWYAAIPACVVERVGPIRSLGRSRELTKGSRWQIFGVVLLLMVLGGIFGGLAFFVANAIEGAVGRAGHLPGIGEAIVMQSIRTVMLLLPSTFQAVAAPVAYYELRSVKEKVAVNSLSNVFD
ncbi:MAG: hypothetical protein LBQ36_06445 [Synergistaceae bacterium]|nr:hypothetical protein [Synergistaceae bacterium]